MWTNIHYLQYKIKEEEEGKEVLSILRGELRLSTKKIRSVKWEERGILLDGQRVTVRARVKAGQLLEVMLNDSLEKEERIAATPMTLSILYEDEDLLFLNKPAGMVSHPSMGHSSDSLANGVKAYFEEKREWSDIHLIGRLDKDTSGVIGIAKNGVTKERLLAMRQEGKIQKEYLALAQGIFESSAGTITIPMEEYREEKDGCKLKMRYPIEGRGVDAVTHYKVIKQYDEYCLLSLFIETGRMHQIRYHMAQIGHPLLGDAMYGWGKEKAHGMTRTALHAKEVHLIHPFTREELVIGADLPEDMKRLC